ncbi:MAG: right-handed parallel beta-helix repeat-containing protein [Balneolaceae bacterium]|nr:right-handed parallel beta-helix repeat-containing protein [Balneolaceae bacterium]
MNQLVGSTTFKSNTILYLTLLCLLSFLTFCSTDAIITDQEIEATVYYFNSETGNDQNSGVSIDSPWKSLSKIDSLDLQPGDRILLAKGQEFQDPIIIKNVAGADDAPILISTYDDRTNDRSDFAFIKTQGHLNAVLVQNSSFVKIENLSISAGPIPGEVITERGNNIMRIGVKIDVSEFGVFENIKLKNLEIKDIFYENPGIDRGSSEVKTANGTQSYGWGIRVFNERSGSLLRNIVIDSVHVENVSHTGIKFTSPKYGDDFGIKQIQVSNSRVYKTGGPGIQMSGVYDGHIFGNKVDRSGSFDDSRKWGRGSGLWTWSTSNVLIEHNSFTNANGPGDSAGAHIDFNCSNIILQYNFSANNAGGFCEILGNNYNCSYRYNISVNDGHRVKGENGAFQEGKVFWLSGYNGNKPRSGPFNSYFYNNTIYVTESIQAKIAIDRMSDGILISNNIFHIEGEAKSVLGDQYNPETEGEVNTLNTVFKNNLFLHNESWPSDYPWQDDAPMFGNAAFLNLGGFSIEDYTPKNRDLIQNKGVLINTIPSDDFGLYIGLEVKQDILGNPIVGLPDLGAIEIQQ